MCPACIASTALIVAGATSGGGLAALVATRLRVNARTKKTRTQPHSKEKPS